MDNKWQFDEEFLKKTVKDGKQLLKRDDISDVQKGLIQETIVQFLQFLDVLEDNYVESANNYLQTSSFNVIKRQFLSKATTDFYKFGDSLIDFIIYLADNCTYLSFEEGSYFSKANPEKITNQSLEVYEEYFPSFYQTARSIVDYPISLINFASKPTIGSQCFYDAILNLPFIHVEKADEFPPTFIHELQHGIEGMKGYRSYLYFRELAPILMETLYIDKMVKDREVDATNLYFDRVMEAEAYLDYVSCYFRLLKQLRKVNFSLSSSSLVTLLHKHQLISGSKMDLVSLLDDNFDDYLMYLISFLRSLEIREKVYQDKKYALKLLKNSLTTSSIRLDEDILLMKYEAYLYEIFRKQKQYPHTKKYYKS